MDKGLMRTEKTEIECPYCHRHGVRRQVARGRARGGISGGKATMALLTGGVSLLATGLTSHHGVTRLHCEHCGMKWTVDR